MRVLVAGGTGPLGPAVAELASRGVHVGLLTRSADAAPRLGEPGRVFAVTADWDDVDSLARALSGAEFDAGLVYAPTAGDRALAVLASAVTGTLVHLLTSGAVDPAARAEPDPASLPSIGVPLLLGWRDGRWHTPQEISDAALAVLADPRPTVLGEVRPWSDRPR